MATTKKKVPADTVLKVGGKADYASSTEKGKGPAKKQAVKTAMKNEGFAKKKK